MKRSFSAWPDVQHLNTLTTLPFYRRPSLISLSNGSLHVLLSLKKYASLPFDAILTSDILGAFKPDPKVYQTACRASGLEPHQTMMVASHIYDLEAAKSIGVC
jgi:2-haloacid dehalogenase